MVLKAKVNFVVFMVTYIVPVVFFWIVLTLLFALLLPDVAATDVGTGVSVILGAASLVGWLLWLDKWQAMREERLRKTQSERRAK